MQCYSRRQIVKHMGLAAGCLLLSPLSGCSTNDRPIDSADNTASDKEQFDWLEATGTYTPSDAFKDDMRKPLGSPPPRRSFFPRARGATMGFEYRPVR